ncbi:MAG: hypothetical protein M3321_00510 [Actinomycetota bacterium]|nr:hypothetical protein [Actinomycetota bacterium]
MFGVADANDSLVFLDVPLGADAALGFRRVSAGTYRHPGMILVRAAGEIRLDELHKVRDALKIGAPIARLVQQPGAAPRLDGEPPREAVDSLTPDVIFRRARAVEVAALVEWSDAIWDRPKFHFELPSGLHTDIFIRLADAIREPRDAAVLASWLTPEMTDGLGVVLDSGTLSALVEALRAEMAAASMTLGPVAVLDQYPRTHLDTLSAVSYAAQAGTGAVGIVSVNVSGQLRGRLYDAFEAYSSLLERIATTHVLVDATSTAPPELPRLETWLALADAPSRRPPRVEEGKCGFCSGSERPYVITITPDSFKPILPSDRTLLMPAVKDASEHQLFWEICDEAGAIGVEQKPRIQPRAFRSPGLMNVLFRLEPLLASDKFVDEVVRRLQDENRKQADLVLVAEGEARLRGFGRFWTRVRPLLGRKSMAFPIDEPWQDPGLQAAVREARTIVVFALGSVTGQSLFKGLEGVQGLRSEWAGTRGVVVHARPWSRREWESLHNAYDKRLTRVWLTYFPERSPLVEEAMLLETVDAEELSPEQAAFRDERWRFCKGEMKGDAYPLFWGSEPDDRLTPHSLYGNLLRARATYAAVGAAMERTRVDAAKDRAITPVFEMPAIVRSYYDPLILSSVLRWLRPHEAFWGPEPDSGAKFVGATIERVLNTSIGPARVLLCELGLAAAEGKLGSGGAEEAYARITKRLTESGLTDRERVALEFSLSLARARRDVAGA